MDLSLGTQLAQVTHAAGESSPGNIPKDTHAVVLHARDEADLLCLEAELGVHGYSFCAIREPDAPFMGTTEAHGQVPACKGLI